MLRYRAAKRSLIVSAAAVALVWLSTPRSAADDDRAAHSVSATAETKANAATQAPAATIDVHAALLHGHREGAKWVSSAGAERRVELTLVPDLQEKARAIFEQYRVPYAAVAAIEPSSGRLLAYVGHSLETPVNDPVLD